MKKDWSAGAGAKCDLLKLGLRTRVREHINLDVRDACVQPKKRSQLTPWEYGLRRPNAIKDQGCGACKILAMPWLESAKDSSPD